MKLNFEQFKNTIIELLRIFFSRSWKNHPTVTQKNILTYFGWVLLCLNCVPIHDSFPKFDRPSCTTYPYCRPRKLEFASRGVSARQEFKSETLS
jgi:hypothetical protein